MQQNQARGGLGNQLQNQLVMGQQQSFGNRQQLQNLMG